MDLTLNIVDADSQFYAIVMTSFLVFQILETKFGFISDLSKKLLIDFDDEEPEEEF
jgi:hypothetical protein